MSFLLQSTVKAILSIEFLSDCGFSQKFHFIVQIMHSFPFNRKLQLLITLQMSSPPLCGNAQSKVVKSSSPLSHTEFLQMAVNFEECRKKWLRADEELVSCKEVLAKLETDRGALEVKLKHARNQVDVEIRRRQKAEAVYEKLVGALLLISLVSLHMLRPCHYC